MKVRSRKKLHPSGFEPTTSGSGIKRSTAAVQPVPPKFPLKIVHFLVLIEFQATDSSLLFGGGRMGYSIAVRYPNSNLGTMLFISIVSAMI